MNKIEFDEGKRRWDHWRAFHNYLAGGFVLFDTGEMVLTSSSFDPGGRTKYGAVGVEIIGTNDWHPYVLKSPDGRKLMKSWLDVKGQQQLAVDLHTGIAVSIENRGGHRFPAEWQKAIPTRFHGQCTVYWPGAERTPIGGSIKIVRPRAMIEDEKKHLAALKDAAMAQRTFEEDDPAIKPFHSYELTQQPFKAEELFDRTYGSLTPKDRARLLKYGVKSPLMEETFTHLIAERKSQ